MNLLKDAKVIAALILAIGIAAGAWFLRSGVVAMAERGRNVTVKGLAVREVDADQVYWPIVFKEVGNDLPTLHKRISSVNQIILKFLKDGGLTDNEISVNAPEVHDCFADSYYDRKGDRYNISNTITVSSKQVDKVRALMLRQGELLQQGVAIVASDYQNYARFEYTGLNDIKSTLMDEAIANARLTADQFATVSGSSLGGIIQASQGQISIENLDSTTPYRKQIRLVATITYALHD